MLRQLWLAMVLLSLGFGPLVLQALQRTGCCCTSKVPTAICHCQELPDDSHCGLKCASEPLQAVLEGSVDPPQDRMTAVAVLTEILVLIPSYKEPPDGRLNLSAGWVLPSSPPLRASLLNLPPPLCC